MAFKFPKVTLNKDGLFGPTKKNNFYNPVYYHNKSASKNPHKTKWILKKNQQYEAFRIGDESDWYCKASKGIISILDNGNIIMGSKEERLSFFPEKININDPYHGYPIDPSEYNLSDELIEKWYEKKIIDYRIYMKLLRSEL